MMNKIFLLYIPLFLSLSLSFLFHAFKKHIRSFVCLATIFNTTNAINNYMLHFKCHHPNSSITIVHVLDSLPLPKPSLSLPPSIGFIDDINERIKGLMTCTESFNFERQVSDEIDDNDNNNDNHELDKDNYWGKVEEFPPPLSSLSKNGQPNFILLPLRENGRLQLSKVRIKKPKILYATRQDGRLRLFLVPDQCIVDDVEEENEEEEDQKLVKELMKEEEMIIESEGELEENDDDVVEEIVRSEEEDIRVREWEVANEMFGRCHEVVNHIHCHHLHRNHLHIYDVGIA